MRATLVLLLTLATLLPGCSAPNEGTDEATLEPPTADAGIDAAACSMRFAGPHGENVVLVSALQDEPDVLAQRLADALADPLAGEPRVEADALVFPTARGELRVERDDAAARVLWTPRDAAPTRAEAEAALASLSPPPGLVWRDEATALQTWAEEPVEATGAKLTQTLVVGPLYEFDDRAPPLAKAQLDERAREVVACFGPDRGASAGPLLVREGALVREYRAGPCTLHLDAASGALVANEGCA